MIKPHVLESGVEENEIEVIQSEIDDLESSPPSYEILTYPADFTLEVLVDKYKKGLILIPGYQRKFVWKLPQASKLIESFLLGLPVPPVFLYTDPKDNTLIVVDGQQRLKSIAYFFEGFFGEEERGRRPVFRLTGLNPKSKFFNCTHQDLKEKNEAAFNKLNDAVLRAFVIKQLNPDDATSVYHIFSRLNTGGTLLRSQEIRNCVYVGTFNDMLIRLNKIDEWRKIFGKPFEDNRQRDVELILRFFALHDEHLQYEKPMTDFLSKFMKKHKMESDDQLKKYEELFISTINQLLKYFGEKPFHIRAGLNSAVFDSVLVALSLNLTKIPADINERYQRLLKNETFLKRITGGTTDNEAVLERIRLAQEILFG